MVIQWVGVRSEFLCVFAIYLVASEEYDFDDRDNDGHSEHGSKKSSSSEVESYPLRISKIFEDGGIALDSSAFRGTFDLRYGISNIFWFILDRSNIFLQFWILEYYYNYLDLFLSQFSTELFIYS